MDRLGEVFDIRERLRLTCCFRCPRRVIFLASQINGAIRATPGAPRGRVEVRTSLRPFETALELAAERPGSIFLARGNVALLDLLQHVYASPVGAGVPVVRWVSPGAQRLVDEALREGVTHGCSIAGLLSRLRSNNQHSPTDRTMVRILDIAMKLDGPGTLVGRSAWLAWLAGALCPGEGTAADGTGGTGGRASWWPPSTPSRVWNIRTSFSTNLPAGQATNPSHTPPLRSNPPTGHARRRPTSSDTT